MKRFFVPCLFVIFLFSFLASTTAAASDIPQDKLAARLEKINAQTEALQRQIQSLQAELRELKAEKRSKVPSHHVMHTTNAQPTKVHGIKVRHKKPYHKYSKSTNKTSTLSEAYHHLRKEKLTEEGRHAEHDLHHPPEMHPGLEAQLLGHGFTVTTSPFKGVKTAFNASDLLEQSSTMNEDLMLLHYRQDVEHYLLEHGISLGHRSIVEISGGVEGQIIYSSGFGGTSGDINLSTAELDINAMASRWANAFFSLEFDSSPTFTGSRVPDSRIYLRRGFLTIGNLDKLPLYFTIGQMYLPFGRYASAMLSAPLTLSMARVLERAAVIGYTNGGFYGQLYGYSGEMTTTSADLIKQGGVNLGYKRTIHNGEYDLGVGVISNIADAEGMQDTGRGGGLFSGFDEPAGPAGPGGGTITFNNLRRRVPAFDVHGEFTWGPVSLMAEYITVLRDFNVADMVFNGSAATPKALHAEIDYLFHIRSKPLTLAFAYGQSWQALALNIPKNSYFLLLSTSLWKNTIESIEYRHDKDYSATANGGTNPFGPIPLIVGVGDTRNIVTAQIGVYF